MKKINKNIVLFIIMSLFIILPLIFNSGSEFGGSDGEGEAAIMEIAPDYEPWFEPFWEPPSGEIESLLFSLQAALGSGVIAYYFGYMKGKKDKDHAYHR